MTTKDVLNKISANQATIISNQEAILAALGSGAGVSPDSKALLAAIADVKIDTAYLVDDTKETATGATTQAPVISGISPSSGTLSGGDTVTLTGTGFTGATTVNFGTVTATPTVLNDTSATVIAPATAAGTVEVAITTPAGASGGVPFTFA